MEGEGTVTPRAQNLRPASETDVVEMIPGTEENSMMSNRIEVSESVSHSSSDHIRVKPPSIDVKRQEISTSIIQMTTSSPGKNNPNTGQNRPSSPLNKSSFPQRSSPTSVYAKPKSRILESQYGEKTKAVEDNANKTSIPREQGSKRSVPITPRTPVMVSGGRGEDDEDEDVDDEVFMTGHFPVDEKKHSREIKVIIFIEWIVFVCILGVLISSLTIDKFTRVHIYGLRIWKWCVLIKVIFCGHLVTGWFTNLLEFLIERNFLLKRKVLYFVYGLKKSFRVFIWLGLILLVWSLLINKRVETARETRKTLNRITKGIASTLIGAGLWMVKTFLIKLLASSFHVKTFFDRIQETVFHQYVLQTLSGSPSIGYEDQISTSGTSGGISFSGAKKSERKGKREEMIDMEKLNKMKSEKVSSWTMSGLIDVISSSGLRTIAGALDDVSEHKEIKTELEAEAEAERIFKNVAKPRKKYIEEEDLLRFMPKEQVDNLIPLFMERDETGHINKSSFENWMIKAYNERKCLVFSLNDTKTAIEELNRIASILVLVISLIVWILFMGITATEVLVFISTHILVLVFIFGNTLQTVFEGIIFTFVVHPFDVGDRCIIDGVEMIVEEMNLLTTIFLKNSNEKIYYPNPVLGTLPISNYNRA